MSAYCPEGCPDADACAVGAPCALHPAAPTPREPRPDPAASSSLALRMKTSRVRRAYAEAGPSYGGSAEDGAYRVLHREQEFDEWLAEVTAAAAARATASVSPDRPASTLPPVQVTVGDVSVDFSHEDAVSLLAGAARAWYDELQAQKTAYAEREQLWHWALVKEQASRRRADRLQAAVDEVRRTVRAVDQTKSATVMVSAVERALEAEAPPSASPTPEPVATLDQVLDLLETWDGDALVTKSHAESLEAHLRAGWPEQV